ncbi:DUF5685 family protein [Zavarzinella formosa]|uniref:DUF5685 family protein n=1 Tax=Zavarzinella formosa TaxID=360055 RepID=UPI0002E7596F|nr:DUF5685 family protein [Zavarzinella formosa]
MFGFLNPRPHTPDYRRAYARLCQHQRVNFGVRSLPFHSYEAVFLYQLAADLEAFPASVMPHVKCCRLAKPANIHRDADAAIGRFCGGVGVLLASIKLDDDVQDAQGFLTRLSRKAIAWVLRWKIRSARKMFTDLDFRFNANVRQLIADHHRLEHSGESPPLADYTEPTANAFGYVFGQMAKIGGLHAQEQVLTTVGRHVGAALIAFDCAVDWKRDRRRGEFNPLADEEAVHEAMVYCLDRLHRAEVFIRTSVSENARSAITLARVQQRLLQLDPMAQGRTCPTPAARKPSRIMLPVLASSGSPTEPDPAGPIDPNATPVVDGIPPELPGGVDKVNQKKGGGSSCCGNPTCDGCCDMCYCGALGADCCSGIDGAGACCAIAECGDCSC